ncbi:MAG: hypothetical protein GTO18_04315 [Anaerolineales bacterium]|nr:hypothetical protein [Anaerolineales bacterium]
MSTYSTRLRPTGKSNILGISPKQFIPRVDLKRGSLFRLIIFAALIAFEIFNYSTTDFALTDLLGDLRFAGIRWATILALAFCGMDFAGIARLFTPEGKNHRSMESWYLLGAWLLAATMNAILTWWAVSLALINHSSLGSEILGRDTILSSVPIFVSILVWLIRVLIIGTFTLSTPRIFSRSPARSEAIDRPEKSRKSRENSGSVRSRRSIRPAPKPKATVPN